MRLKCNSGLHAKEWQETIQGTQHSKVPKSRVEAKIPSTPKKFEASGI